MNFIIVLRWYKMLEQIKENSIVIVKDSFKKSFIEEIRKNSTLFNIKVFGLKEFKKKFYFDYSKKAAYFIHKKYDVIKEIAEIYLENLYYLNEDETEGDEENLKLLKKIKKDLERENLITYDNYFKKYLKDKTVVLYNLNYVDNFYDKMFEDLNKIAHVEKILDSSKQISKKKLYSFKTMEEEIIFVASEIATLLKNGIAIDKIKLANIKEDYIFPLESTFKAYHIPLELEPTETISSTMIAEEFKENYSKDIEACLEKIRELITSKKDEKIYRTILDVLNDYTWCEDFMEVRDFVFKDLDSKKVPKNKLKHAIKTVDFLNDSFKDDEYIFLLNFNQGSIPVCYKDENYLSDETRLALGISDSIDLNKKETALVREKIATTKNLIVTYKTSSLQGEQYISSAYDEALFENCTSSKSFEHSDNFNKRLLVKNRDEFRKYGSVCDDLLVLENHYREEPYMDYDNGFKGLDSQKLLNYLNGKLTLSYSSMNSYYKCRFRYYLDNIVKVDKFEDTFEIIVGNIFHEVLSKAFEEDFDFDTSWEKAIAHTEFDFKNKDLFFLTILKDELINVIDEIKSQKEFTSLDKALYEQKISVLSQDGKVEFKGFVDKIMYGKFDNRKIVSIVDYKTGNPELNIDNAIYGLDMQLPIYAYLIENFEELKDAEIGGFYLQKILNNIKSPEKKKEALKLQGYSNSSLEVLNLVDKSYADSKMIKSMRTSSNGFYSYAKVLSTDEIKRLISLVSEKIDEASRDILSAKFNIDPKQIDDKLVGCQYCKYKDICYVKNKDIQKLKKTSRKDFLKKEGEDNADMD